MVLVFDLNSATSPWTGIFVLFAIGGLALALSLGFAAWIVRSFAVADARRADSWCWFLTLFCGLVAAALLFGGVHQTMREQALHEAMRLGPVRTVEGCLEYFAPEDGNGSRFWSVDESWSVAGERFHYAKGNMGSAFHKTAAEGGPVHADSRVRVSFVRDWGTGGKAIVRLEVQDRACPPAPRPESTPAPQAR